MTVAETTLALTVQGPDRPGITAAVTGILAKGRARILDIQQVVLGDRLLLSVMTALPASEGEDLPTVKDLLFEAKRLGVRLDFEVLDGAPVEAPAARGGAMAVTFLAPHGDARPFAALTGLLARGGVNIDEIKQLSHGETTAVELLVRPPDHTPAAGFKSALMELARAQRIDVAVQPDSLFRRNKRLVVFDLDSTLIRQEMIDELARAVGRYDEVAHITERAMRGELDFRQSLTERVALLAGAPESILNDVYRKVEYTPGAERLCKVLKRLGYKSAVISGGFTRIVDRVREHLGLDYSFANTLEIRDGRLTGRVVGAIVDKQRKGDLLELLAQQERIHPDQTVAVGDGANDLLMLEKAGVGIAFNAKPAVQAASRFAVNQPSLEAVLYLLGISAAETAQVDPLLENAETP